MYYLTMYDVLFANYNGKLVTLMCNLGAVALFFVGYSIFICMFQKNIVPLSDFYFIG